MMSTQFSFGRFFAVVLSSLKTWIVDGIDSFHAWREERRRERERREVIAKHTKKGAPPPEVKQRPAPAIASPATEETSERRPKAPRANGAPAKEPVRPAAAR